MTVDRPQDLIEGSGRRGGDPAPGPDDLSPDLTPYLSLRSKNLRTSEAFP